MKRLVSVLVLVALVNCAHGPRHIGTVGSVSVHATLSAIQDFEMKMVCGLPTAPQPPKCVPEMQHRAISKLLWQGFDIDGRAARAVKALGEGQELPPDYPTLVTQVYGIIRAVMDMIPESEGKTALAQKQRIQ